ncbi:hypothetical protein LCGC14_0501370 [marine sediment metagenome]|uniref:Uncharacterized protein n=1 Tax=marine sediment metagenome TaxID=412755 RepID=A0A0F9UQN4_9ZZZZ
MAEATNAVEAALNQIGVLQSAKKETRDDNISEKYGECVICGNKLTERGACIECIQRFSG